VSFARRSAAMPEVPPLAEAAETARVRRRRLDRLLAPAGTPREYSRAFRARSETMQAQDLRESDISPWAWRPVANTPDEMTAFCADEQGALTAEIVRKANVKVE